MSRVFVIFRNGWRLLRRDRVALLVTFLLPILFSVFLSIVAHPMVVFLKRRGVPCEQTDLISCCWMS